MMPVAFVFAMSFSKAYALNWNKVGKDFLSMKTKLKKEKEGGLEWLKDDDILTRATKGFESALNWMFKTDNQKFLASFFAQTRKYDKVRNENTIDVFPEWKELFDKYEKN